MGVAGVFVWAMFVGAFLTFYEAFELGHQLPQGESLTGVQSRRARRALPYRYMCNIDTLFQCVCINPPDDIDTSDVQKCRELIEDNNDMMDNGVKLTMTYTPPPHYSELNLTTNVQIATAIVLNDHCISDDKKLDKACSSLKMDLAPNFTTIFDPANVIVISVEESGDDVIELKVSFFVVYHEKPNLESSSLSISNTEAEIDDFKVVGFSLLRETITEVIMTGGMSRALGVEVQTLELYHMDFPYAEVIAGCMGGAIFILICILSACKASK